MIREEFRKIHVNTSKYMTKTKETMLKGGSRTSATSKMELPAVNYYHKALHLGCSSSPRSVSDARAPIQFIYEITLRILMDVFSSTGDCQCF